MPAARRDPREGVLPGELQRQRLGQKMDRAKRLEAEGKEMRRMVGSPASPDIMAMATSFRSFIITFQLAYLFYCLLE